MAKVLGESGRYVSNQAVVKLQRILLSNIIIIAFASMVEGLILGRWLFPIKPAPALSISIMVSLLVIMLWVWRSFSAKMAVLEKERSAMQRGAAGEIGVGAILQKFPDNFYVINDLTTLLSGY